jgi:hypothetical protein
MTQSDMCPSALRFLLTVNLKMRLATVVVTYQKM